MPRLHDPKYLITLYCSVNNIKFTHIRKIGHIRCCYCLGKPKDVGLLKLFVVNRTRLHRCKMCSWKLGLVKFEMRSIQNGFKLNEYGLWSNPDNLLKHENAMIDEYKLNENLR